MDDSSEGSAHPNGVSSIATLDRPDATYTLALTAFSPAHDTETDIPSIGLTIKGSIEAAAQLNRAAGQRGRSWALYGREPNQVWPNRTRWLTIAAAELASSEGRQLCRSKHLSPQTALLIARACSRFADSRTGRGVTASNRTIGQVAAELANRAKPYSHDVIANARAVLAALGLAVEVEKGRYLNAAERFLATVHHEGVQNRAASTWSLTTPRRWYKKSCLPRRGSTGRFSPRRNNSPKRAQARAVAPSGRGCTKKKEPRALAAQRTTAQLVARTRSLDTGRHLGYLVDVVDELVDCSRWTGADLVFIIDKHTRERGFTWPDRIDNPAAFLRSILSVLAPRLAQESPSELAARRKQEVQDEQQARRTEQEKAHARAASPESVKSHMAAIRATLASRARARNH